MHLRAEDAGQNKDHREKYDLPKPRNLLGCQEKTAHFNFNAVDGDLDPKKHGCSGINAF